MSSAWQKSITIGFACWMAFLLAPLPVIAEDVPAPPSFEKDILPILAQRCHDCHGGDLKEARLDLRTLSSMLRGGESGPAVVRGQPQTSLLVERVLSREMPPGKEKLTAAESALIQQWVKAGLPAKEQIGPPTDSLFTEEEQSHWAFRPLVSLSVPAIQDADQDRTPIDRFLLARLQAKHLSFARPADRQTLLRRVTFDLTGLPPTVEELVEFEQDTRAEAYEAAVERLLNSPQFGVRWGRHWLDIAGYTDTVTFDEDFGPVRGFAEGKWRYRDYVIDAFNQDLPYDQFILEQLAGDEFVEWRNAAEYSPEVVKKLVATGFLRTPEDLTVDDPRPFVIWSTVHETVEHIGASFLGLSLLCARCHSHKFEPIPQRDYYAMMALVTPALNPKAWKNGRERLLPDAPEIQKHNSEIDRSVGEAQQQIATIRRGWEVKLRDEKLKAIPEPIRLDLRTALDLPADKQDPVQKYLVDKLGPLVKVEPAAIDAVLTETERESLKQMNARIAELNAKKRTHGWIHAVYDVGPPPATHLFKRGEFETPGREVPPGFLRVLSGPDTEKLLETTLPNTSGRRTALAHWITGAESPASGLAARVMVNRIWQHLFGQGLSATSENVGMSGSAPTHPELLDWLAADFRANGWKIKRAIRQIVLSAAYRQSSVADRRVAAGEQSPTEVDPHNTLLWRMRLRRLDAEAMRDAIAWQSGRLDLSLGGPPIALDYDLKSGRVSDKDLAATAAYRRSVYLENRRVYNPTFLSTFDRPIVTRGVCRREQSATAPQALSLMNDPFMVTNSERCADGIRSRAKSSPDEQIQEAYRLILGRVPDGDEKGWCGQLLVEQSALYEKAGLSAEEAARRGLASLCQTLWGTNDFLYLREGPSMTEYTILTRRAMLQQSAFGLGAFALGDLLARDGAWPKKGVWNSTDFAGGVAQAQQAKFQTPFLGQAPRDGVASPAMVSRDLSPRRGDFPAAARSVIMLFQNGGPSHMDLFDPKPELNRRHGEKVAIKNAMQGNEEPLMGSKFAFHRRGESGIEFSELLPNIGEQADDLCVVRSLFHEDPNHPGGTYMLCSCNRRPGRPSLGSWVVYGLGSESQNLPAFVCLRDPAVFHSGGSMQITNAWLPSVFRGSELRTEGEPVLNLRSPVDLPPGFQQNSLNLIARLNDRHRRDYPDDTELNARIRNYELASRMQLAAASELDLSSESSSVHELYGTNDPATASYGRKCLMARRLVERGVRFVQVLAPAPHNSWDHHGDIDKNLPKLCGQVDRPSAALIRDLKQRGLLDSTIVLWVGEFGRMPISQGGTGRDHNPHGFTALLAGGGFKRGHVHGATDEFGYRAVTDRMSVPDLMATVLYQLGLDHAKLTYPNHGVEESLTEARITKAQVVKQIVAASGV